MPPMTGVTASGVNGSSGTRAFMGLGASQLQDSGDPSRFIPTQGGNYRHIRHAEILARWPVIAEPWAQRIETGRVN